MRFVRVQQGILVVGMSLLAWFSIMALPSPLWAYTTTTATTPLSEDRTVDQYVTTLLTVGEGAAAPTHQLISPGVDVLPGLTVITMSLRYEGLPTQPVLPPPRPLGQPDLIDNWQPLLDDGFEEAFPPTGCTVFDDSDDGYERYWGVDNGRVHEGNQALWPAKGGGDGVDPTGTAYPDDLDSWLVCGPFDLSQAEKFMVQFSYWLDVPDPMDGFFFGVSTDGMTFQGSMAAGATGSWVVRQSYVQGVVGDESVWLAWVFASDGQGVFGEGAWLDGVKVWQYAGGTAVCGDVDPGRKGIVLPPYDPTANGEVPMIRPGDTLAVAALQAAGVNWVRLGFIHRNGVVDWQGYDRMVDTLCAHDISVLGLVNNEILLRQDFNEAATAEAYRQEFNNVISFGAAHYQGRITYWEVWNEPNLGSELGGAFVDPIRFAPLLDDAYQAVKAANPQAQVLFGGLASAWDDSDLYLQDVYDNSAGTRQFDYFAVHPYPNDIYGPDPEVYMYAVSASNHDTIMDKFMETMFNHMQENKQVWVTEIGWNSAKGLPNRPTCHDPVLVAEGEQANYLKPMFDTLFNEVFLWNQTTLAVEKVIWYQYMDIGIADPCDPPGRAVASRAHVSLREMSASQGDAVWLFGLYRSDKVTPKPVFCAYAAYPFDCHHTYLPIVQLP